MRVMSVIVKKFSSFCDQTLHLWVNLILPRQNSMRVTTPKLLSMLIVLLFSLAACSPSEEPYEENEAAEAMDKAGDEMEEAGDEMAEETESAMSEAESAMSEAEEAGKEWADDAKQKAGEVGDEMKEQGEALKEKSKEMYEDGKRAMTDKADEMANWGICYDKVGCNSEDKTASSVTKSQCDASGGKSWYNSAAEECESL